MSLASLQAQTPSEQYLNESIQKQDFDKKEWETMTKDLDFSEQPEKEKKEKKKKDSQPIQNTTNPALWGNIFKVVAVLLAVAIIVLLMVHFMGDGNLFNPKNRKIKRNEGITLENLEENLEHAVVTDFIQQAVLDQNFALAVRLYYLNIIKALSQGRVIKWKKDKTNGDYLRELNNHELYKDFRTTTLIYERVWFGKNALTETDFKKLQPQFENLVDRVGNN